MRNIRNCEANVMEALKTITIEKDNKTHLVSAIYADYEKLKAFVTTKTDGCLELKNNPLKLPAIGITATAINRNSIEFEGNILAASREDLTKIIENLFCTEVEDRRGNNDLTVHRAEISQDDSIPAVRAKFTMTLNM